MKLNIIDNFSCRFLIIYFFTEYLTTIPEKKMVKDKELYINPTLLSLNCTRRAKKADGYPPSTPQHPPSTHPHFYRSEQQNVDIQVR